MNAARSLDPYDGSALRADVVAGLTLVALTVPAAMAYAHLAGLPVHVGLASVGIPAVAYGLIGRVASMAIGPIASAALLTGVAIGRASGTPLDGLAIAAALAVGSAVVYLVVAMTGLGQLVDRVSSACLLGFVSGIGFWMIGSQLDSLAGLPSDHPSTLWGDVADIIGNLGHASGWTVAVSAGSLALLWMLHKLAPQLPGVAIAVVVGIGVSVVLDLHDRGVATVGTLPAGLTGLRLPALGGLGISAVASVLAIVVIGLVEMVAVAREQDDSSIAFQPRRETVAIGAASLGAGLFGGMPVAGAPGRSAVAREAGARTAVTSIVLGSGVIVLLLVGTTWLAPLPIATIGAVVVYAGMRLTRLGRLRALASSDHRRGALALVTLGVTLINVESGVAALILLSVIDTRTDPNRLTTQP